MPTYADDSLIQTELIQEITKKAYKLSSLSSPEDILLCLNDLEQLTHLLKKMAGNEASNSHLFHFLKDIFPCTYNADTHHIELTSNQTMICLRELNVEKHKFLFFFIEKNERLTYDKILKQHILKIIQQAISAAQKEGLEALILQYENVNRTCFLESNDLKRFTFTFHMEETIPFSYPTLFESSLPKWYYRFPI